ncbi:hypothetical protein [Cerasicoccus frondis]|uniref:hypothetical protein n=1 Tax=Cerasicoccus frondis TaxID=490090 RepID=UPI0028529659|nr:hypothetical protein [Cerasicoccus frondis]
MKLVQPICRDGLTNADLAFLQSVLAPDGSAAEALIALLADPPMRDQLLDEPAVFQAVLEQPLPINISPRLYFYVLVRHRFTECGLEDRDLADYVASLMADSMSTSRVFNGNQNGKRQAAFYAVDVMSQIQQAGFCERFYLTVCLAERSLVVTGLFRPHVDYRATYRGAPALNYYENIGQAHYRAAGDHHLAHEYCLTDCYQALGNRFTEARRALNYVAETLTFMGQDGLN